MTSVDYDAAGLAVADRRRRRRRHRRAGRRQAADRRSAVRQRRRDRPGARRVRSPDRRRHQRRSLGDGTRSRPAGSSSGPIRLASELAQEYGDLGGWMQITDAAGQSLADGARPRRSGAHADDSRRQAVHGGVQRRRGCSPPQTTPDRSRGDLHLHLGRVALAEVTDGSVDVALPLRRRRPDRRHQRRNRLVDVRPRRRRADHTARVARPGASSATSTTSSATSSPSPSAGETWRFEYDTPAG